MEDRDHTHTHTRQQQQQFPDQELGNTSPLETKFWKEKLAVHESWEEAPAETKSQESIQLSGSFQIKKSEVALTLYLEL